MRTSRTRRAVAKFLSVLGKVALGKLASFHEKAAAKAFFAEPMKHYDKYSGNDYVNLHAIPNAPGGALCLLSGQIMRIQQD